MLHKLLKVTRGEPVAKDKDSNSKQTLGEFSSERVSLELAEKPCQQPQLWPCE